MSEEGVDGGCLAAWGKIVFPVGEGLSKKVEGWGLVRSWVEEGQRRVAVTEERCSSDHSVFVGKRGPGGVCVGGLFCLAKEFPDLFVAL